MKKEHLLCHLFETTTKNNNNSSLKYTKCSKNQCFFNRKNSSKNQIFLSASRDDSLKRSGLPVGRPGVKKPDQDAGHQERPKYAQPDVPLEHGDEPGINLENNVCLMAQCLE